jgi:ubiquinone/menaquinone biosynthesis C-methylase UbiE
MAHVAPNLVELYQSYYETNRDESNRTLSAKDTVEHIRSHGDQSLGRLLDVGAGNGSTLAAIEKAGLASELYALEISPTGAARIEGRGLRTLRDVRQFDGYSIPYPDKAFDTAICIHVIEHVEHERLFLRELARVANTVFVEVPLEGGLRGRVVDTYGHINFYTPMIFLNLLKTAGLRPVSHRVVTSSKEYEQLCYGKIRGAVKNAIRRTVLKLLPEAAPHLMTYLINVKCTTD